MNKFLYLSVTAITLAQVSSPCLAMDYENRSAAKAKPSRFATKKQVDRFDPPAMVDNDALLKIYGAALVGTNKEQEAHELDKKLTRRPITTGESGAYVEIVLNGVSLMAAHKEPSGFAQDRKLKAIKLNANVVAMLEEPETRIVPTMGMQSHESVGGKYKLYLIKDPQNPTDMESVLTDIEGWDYSGPKPIPTTNQVETFVSLVFTREIAKKSEQEHPEH